jgi:hypothetical protein
MYGCSSQCGAYRACQRGDLSSGRLLAGSPLLLRHKKFGTPGGRPKFRNQKAVAIIIAIVEPIIIAIVEPIIIAIVVRMLVLAAHDHHALLVRKARRPGRWLVPLPLLLLHLRPQTAQPWMPCAGLRLARSSGLPPRDSGIT